MVIHTDSLRILFYPVLKEATRNGMIMSEAVSYESTSFIFKGPFPVNFMLKPFNK